MSFILLLLGADGGCADGETEVKPERELNDHYTIYPNGSWESGVWDANTDCSVVITSGLRDYTNCCPEGTVPIAWETLSQIICR